MLRQASIFSAQALLSLTLFTAGAYKLLYAPAAVSPWPPFADGRASVRALGAAELVLAVLPFVPMTARLGAWVTAGLYAGFLVYRTRRHSNDACGCHPKDLPADRASLAASIVFVVLALIVAASSTDRVAALANAWVVVLFALGIAFVVTWFIRRRRQVRGLAAIAPTATD